MTSRMLMKMERDKDFYVEWSFNTDSPLRSGTRAEFQALEPHIYDDKRFDRADKDGSSYLLDEGKWDAERLTYYGPGGPGSIAREDAGKVLDLICDNMPVVDSVRRFEQ